MLGALTVTQAAYYLHWLPTVEARKHYGVAKLAATVKNMMGGKPDGNEARSKLLPMELLYTPDEELPFFAHFDTPSTMSVEAARDLIENVTNLPAWARDIAPIDEAKRVLVSS